MGPLDAPSTGLSTPVPAILVVRHSENRTISRNRPNPSIMSGGSESFAERAGVEVL